MRITSTLFSAALAIGTLTAGIAAAGPAQPQADIVHGIALLGTIQDPAVRVEVDNLLAQAQAASNDRENYQAYVLARRAIDLAEGRAGANQVADTE